MLIIRSKDNKQISINVGRFRPVIGVENTVDISEIPDNTIEIKPDGIYSKKYTPEDVDFLASYIIASN